MKSKNLIHILMLLTVAAPACSNKNEQAVKRRSLVMGSTIEVQVRGTDEKSADIAITAAFSEANRIDTLFSTYIKNNEMWRINNSGKEEIEVDPEIFLMLQKCEEIWKLTDGAFDVAVGKLIDLIDFEKDSPGIPPPGEVLKALENTGWKKIKLRKPNVLIKPVNVRISFNSCVPGYAADRCSRVLEQHGIKNYLLNVGGEIFAKGNDWKIGIQHPRKENELMGSISVSGKGAATSGDYQQFFRKNGKRYTHIFNPVTGNPANECEAVTVIAEDAFTADALSTGIFVLGPEKGIELVEKLKDVEAIIVDSTGTVHESSGFKKYLMR